MDGWNDFFVAMAGATVAFAGLVLVSISIDLDRILKQPGLVERASIPLIVLFTVFASAASMLIPTRSIRDYGIWLLALAIAFSIVLTTVLRRQRRLGRKLEQQKMVPRGSFFVRIGLCAITAVLLLAAGVIMVRGIERGIFFLASAMFVGFLLAFLEAWVLLV